MQQPHLLRRQAPAVAARSLSRQHQETNSLPDPQLPRANGMSVSSEPDRTDSIKHEEQGQEWYDDKT